MLVVVVDDAASATVAAAGWAPTRRRQLHTNTKTSGLQIAQ